MSQLTSKNLSFISYIFLGMLGHPTICISQSQSHPQQHFLDALPSLAFKSASELPLVYFSIHIVSLYSLYSHFIIYIFLKLLSSCGGSVGVKVVLLFCVGSF